MANRQTPIGPARTLRSSYLWDRSSMVFEDSKYFSSSDDSDLDTDVKETMMKMVEGETNKSRVPSSGDQGLQTRTRSKRLRLPKFRVSLTREEVEEDFRAIGVPMPSPKNDKKRPRAVQNEIDRRFPGMGMEKVVQDLLNRDNISGDLKNK